jgi:Tfp pilus assembly protein PilP
MSTQRNAVALALALSLAGLAGCGEDDPPPPPKNSRPKAAAAAAAGGRGGAALPTEQLVAYKKVEDVVTPDEAKTIRHQFKPVDFQQDPSGTSNRDPFRSYIIAQVSVNPQGNGSDDTSVKTEKCANKKIAAAGYSTHELRLIGVVSRGTIRFATFADSGNVGWVVTRGDCIGSEHARVKLIGEAFVTLEYPGAPATATDPAPRADEREYQLYPKDLATDMANEEEGEPIMRRRPPPIDITPEPDEVPAPPPPGGKINQ